MRFYNDLKMKLILFLLASTTVFAHDYYFAFAEVAYNEDSNKIETTLTISTHDLERALKKKISGSFDIGEMTMDSKELEVIQEYILKHFKIESISKVKLRVVGFESNLKGMTSFYLESEPVELKESVTVHFDLLMETYKEQQNKITFYHKGNSYTKPFLYSKRIQIINLKK